ncbi:Vesicle-associated protein 2-2-like [Quillaja saponaria]|uniref:Vesicle-associated protein 2-2-like n=1 Tax=Quillaja saponaria TaxID=32244 RepID=A0AAD7LCU2_QUISA|nr:Vesicle-associated protein 2-2-like [Quillaja saponaria]
MATELLEIEPRELKFVFELKKQSSCSIQLGNKCDHYIAFKVKTTSPKKYCVRPNTGIIKPKERCDFTVTMQAQRILPHDMQCKDKFLVQSTIVPFGTTEEDITSEMFSKDSGKHVEEKKLRVLLISPPSSPVLVPVNGEVKQDPCNETQLQKDRVLSGVENMPPPFRVAEDLNGQGTAKDLNELERVKDLDKMGTTKDLDELGTAKDVVSRPAENVEDLQAEKVEDMKTENVEDMKTEIVEDMKPTRDDVQLNLAKDSEELKSKLSAMDLKLKEAELTIKKLTEERSMRTQEKDMLKYDLEVMKRKSNVRRVQVGFPLLYVCLVVLISMAVGYYIHL